MTFGLFLLLNAILLLRPEELFPEIAGLRLYLIVIVPCTLLALPRILELLTPDSLRKRPVTVCVLLFYASTIISLIVRGQLEEALLGFGADFAKVILYYFLLLAIVDTRERFNTFVGALVLLISALTALALAQMNGMVDFEAIHPFQQREIDAETGEAYILPRLVSAGIFNDPNDLCLILGLGILSCIYCATTSRLGIIGLLFWLMPIPIFVYALLETHSRGGLLGVVVGLAAYVYSRFGGPKALPYATAGAILVIGIVGGRQASIAGAGTANTRLMLWAEGLTELFGMPFYIPTGLGPGWYAEEIGHVAHNSFIHAYVELGLLGGGAFLAAFYFSGRILDRFGRGINATLWAVQARHYGFAVLVGYAMGCFSLSRNYSIPTYLALGLTSVLLNQASERLPEKYHVNQRWFAWGILVSVCGLALLKVMTQVLSNVGI